MDTVPRIQLLYHFAHVKIGDKWRPALKIPCADKASLLIQTKLTLAYYVRLMMGFRAGHPKVCCFGILIILN